MVDQIFRMKLQPVPAGRDTGEDAGFPCGADRLPAFLRDHTGLEGAQGSVNVEEYYLNHRQSVSEREDCVNPASMLECRVSQPAASLRGIRRKSGGKESDWNEECSI